MADEPISSFPTETSPSSGAFVPIVDSGSNFKTTISDLVTAGGGGGGGSNLQIYDVLSPPYNATGNGTSDDTAAIQAAVTACAVTGGIVLLPRGTGPSSGYVISAPIVVAGNNVCIMGQSNSIKWIDENLGTQILVPSGFTGAAVFDFTAGAAENCSIQNLYIVGTGSPVTALALRAGAVNGFTAQKIFAANVGGVLLSGSARCLLEDVVLQGYVGNRGFECDSNQILYLNRCNAQAAVGTGARNFFISGGETVISTGCESQGGSDYGLYYLNSNDGTFWDFECNGATVAQMFVSGGSDNRFLNMYVEQGAPIGVSITGTTLLQFIGGIVANQNAQVLINASQAVIFSDNFLLNTTTSTGPVVQITGASFDIIVSGNVIGGGTVNFAGILDQSSTNPRQCVYSNNNFVSFGSTVVAAGLLQISSFGNTSDIMTQGNSGDGFASSRVIVGGLNLNQVPAGAGVLTNAVRNALAFPNSSGTGSGFTIFGAANGLTLNGINPTVIYADDVGNKTVLAIDASGNMACAGGFVPSSSVPPTGGFPGLFTCHGVPGFSTKGGSICMSDNGNIYVNAGGAGSSGAWTQVTVP